MDFKHNPYIDSHYPLIRNSKFPLRTTRAAKKAVYFQEGVLPTDDPVSLSSAPETAHTLAEQMSKEQRFILPRGKFVRVFIYSHEQKVTSYCTAESYNITLIEEWAKRAHNIDAKQFDECLYICYDTHGRRPTTWNGQSSYHMLTVSLNGEKSNPFGYISQVVQRDDELPSWMFRREGESSRHIFPGSYSIL